MGDRKSCENSLLARYTAQSLGNPLFSEIYFNMHSLPCISYCAIIIGE